MKSEGWLAQRSSGLSAWLAGFICCGVAALAWLGYRAANEWQQSSAQLVQRRTEEIADLLTTAVTRDMRAVQVSILDGREWDRQSLDAPYELNDTVQAAFARYPYPEVFFAWRESPAQAVFFARSDRRPEWLPPDEGEDTYPVEIVGSPPTADIVFNRVFRDVSARHPYALSEINIGAKRYQVVARVLYAGLTRDQPQGVFGFLVDLDWIRRQYFSSITEQVNLIARTDDSVECVIVDHDGRPVVGQAPLSSAAATRQFPLVFFDPALVAGGAPDDLTVRHWSVQVNAANDPTLAIAARGARRTLVVVGAGAIALGLGLLITVRASRAAAATATMRADFISTVTHALKTPVSVIRGVGETLIRGRVTTPERLREYSQLLVQEGHRLTRLIDNILAYARVTEAANVYAFRPHAPGAIVEEVMKEFQRLMTEGEFDIRICVEQQLPPVRADRTSVVLALDNLIDNAMRYSGDARTITVRVQRVDTFVEFAIIDLGVGIAQDDLQHVQRRFVRGKSAGGHGSGLGLPIASRIARDHGGRLLIESRTGAGTTVKLLIPAEL
jgi:signal transduction histidine kinase